MDLAPMPVAHMVEQAPARRAFPPIPASALRTMTWSELWTCEDLATASGDVAGVHEVAAEIARRRGR